MPALPSTVQRLVPSRKTRSYLYLALAVVLLMNPLYLAGWQVDRPVYGYEAAAVSYEPGDGLQFRPLGDSYQDYQFHVDGILCSGGLSRECSLAAAVRENETFDPTGVPYFRHYEYALFDGYLYRPTEVERGSYVLGYERTNGSQALERLAEDGGRPPAPVRKAVRTGELVTTRQLDTNQVYEHDGNYYIVYRTFRGGTGTCELGSDDPDCTYRRHERLLVAGATLAGVLLLWRTKRLAEPV